MSIEEEIKQNRFRNSYQKASINLVYTADWLLGRQKDFFKQFHITNQQFNILRILRGQFPAKISGAEIKSRMIDRNSDVSRLLDRLALKKMITKSQSADDKRATLIVITAKGLALLKEIDNKMDCLDNLMSKLTKADATHLSDLLDLVRG
jgi:DNA-binding MarR family transcriptional regulator